MDGNRLSAEQIISISRRNKDTYDIVRKAYLRVMRDCDFNKTEVVRRLRIPRQSLYNDLERFGIVLEGLKESVEYTLKWGNNFETLSGQLYF